MRLSLHNFEAVAHRNYSHVINVMVSRFKVFEQFMFIENDCQFWILYHLEV